MRLLLVQIRVWEFWINIFRGFCIQLLVLVTNHGKTDNYNDIIKTEIPGEPKEDLQQVK